jgi:hypothetical protein
MKEMARLAFLAYVGDNLKGSDSKVEKEIAPCMTSALAAQAPAWELVWGPAVYHFESNGLDDNMMYVVREKADPSTLAVVVRGTNPDALIDWLVEDFDIVDQVSWPGLPSSQAKISKGTSEGLHILQGMTAQVHGSTPSERQDLTQFLASQVANPPQLRNLYIAGHSLGGALSPAVALWLTESRNLWDHAQQVQIHVYPLAGPTPGNADFAAYYDRSLGASTHRMWNPFDVVPRAWNHQSMGTLEDIYEPFTRAAPLERGLIDSLRWLAKDKGYIQIDASQESLSGFVQTHNWTREGQSCKTRPMDWLSEVGWQHHWGYQCALGILINPSLPGCDSKTPPPCPEICQTS